MAPSRLLASLLVNLLLAGFPWGSAAATQLTSSEQGHLRLQHGSAQSEGRGTIIKHGGAQARNLMLCNAYADARAVDAFRLSSRTRLTESGPLAYKSCSTYRLPLREGEQIEFMIGNLSVGVFKATGVPRSPASLLLVLHRRTPTARNAAFESHAFADAPSSQLVVVDVYGGHETGAIKIKDVPMLTQGEEGPKKIGDLRTEDLKFNSVVHVTPGDYELLLLGAEKNLGKVLLHVPQQKANFVLLRTGNQVQKTNLTQSFPQELVLTQEDSGTLAAAHPQSLALATALSAGLVWWF